MTVAELRERLADIPGETLVMLDTPSHWEELREMVYDSVEYSAGPDLPVQVTRMEVRLS